MPDIDGPVVVVGAGIAGLAAAFRLWQAGQPIMVLEQEAPSLVGGRMASIERNGFPRPWCAAAGGPLHEDAQTDRRRGAGQPGAARLDLVRGCPGWPRPPQPHRQPAKAVVRWHARPGPPSG